MSRSWKVLASAGLALGAVGMIAGGAASGAATPHITASPTHVMVNSPVRLVGTGFTPATTITLRECSAKTWVVPASPCLTTNEVTVTTNSAGGFRTHMKAGICPVATPGPITERTCYIGEPRPSGIDTITLVGAAKIVVSWP
jgi:hypothetical protein